MVWRRSNLQMVIATNTTLVCGQRLLGARSGHSQLGREWSLRRRVSLRRVLLSANSSIPARTRDVVITTE